MQALYDRIGKEAILKDPNQYTWNCVLCYLQFTQVELLQVRAYLDMRSMILYQSCVTQAFLKEHFLEEINENLAIDWILIKEKVKHE